MKIGCKEKAGLGVFQTCTPSLEIMIFQDCVGKGRAIVVRPDTSRLVQENGERIDSCDTYTPTSSHSARGGVGWIRRRVLPSHDLIRIAIEVGGGRNAKFVLSFSFEDVP